MVADLTGCEMANASMLDEATAAAEAMTMLRRVSKTGRPAPASSSTPTAIPRPSRWWTTRAEPLGIELTVGDPHQLTSNRDRPPLRGARWPSRASTGEPAGPGTRSIDACPPGRRRPGGGDHRPAGLLPHHPSGGRWGPTSWWARPSASACPMGFGGPHAGFMATSQSNARSLPGRLVGVSVDSAGNPGLPPGPADPRAAHPA